MALRSTGLLSSIRSRVSSSHSPLSAIASSSRAPALVRTHTHSVAAHPRRKVIIDGVDRSPISSFDFLPEPPFTPLFPIYLPLSSINPVVPNSVARESVIPLPRDIFGTPLRKDILHQCVVHHQSLQRGLGGKHTLGRAEVRGSGRKLHAQKGSGRARVGDSGSGIRVGGGATFGPRTRDWSTELPRKVRQLGVKVAFSQKLREGKLWALGDDGLVMQDWNITIPGQYATGPLAKAKTVPGSSEPGHLYEAIQKLGLHKPLFLHSPFHTPPAHFFEAMAKIPNARVESISSIGAYDMLLSHDIVADKPALEWLISMIRNHQQIARAEVFSGNAMVMRRRQLGLSDFPAEGEQDESKEMLEALEREVAAGGAGGFEVWRENAVKHAIEAKETAIRENRERIIVEGTREREQRIKLVKEGVIDAPVYTKERRLERLEKEESVEVELTEEQEIERDDNEADSLVNSLKE